MARKKSLHKFTRKEREQGGAARANALTPEERTAIARLGAQTRWASKRSKAAA